MWFCIIHAAWRAVYCTVNRTNLRAQHMCRLPGQSMQAWAAAWRPVLKGRLACLQAGWLAGTDVVHRERLQTLEANVLLLESSLGATHPQASCSITGPRPAFMSAWGFVTVWLRLCVSLTQS